MRNRVEHEKKFYNLLARFPLSELSGVIKFRINQDFLIEHSCILHIRSNLLYPPQTLFVGGILFSCCPCVRPSVRP